MEASEATEAEVRSEEIFVFVVAYLEVLHDEDDCDDVLVADDEDFEPATKREATK